MPGSTTSKRIHWVYVLLSLSDNKRYIGFTTNLNERLNQHYKGQVFSTKSRRPLTPIYLEGCLNKDDAEEENNI
jgi:putative endonuclease